MARKRVGRVRIRQFRSGATGSLSVHQIDKYSRTGASTGITPLDIEFGITASDIEFGATVHGHRNQSHEYGH